MNYLAHAYLSFNDPEVLLGNMISDHVKGRTKFDYELRVQKGIMLHRAIDTFTDQHHVTKTAMKFFKPAYGLYAGAFVDVVYDHFLALDKNEFSMDSLYGFSQNTYMLLERYRDQFPPRFQFMFPFMKQHDWLFNYRNRWAIERSFHALVNRAAYLTEGDTAFSCFEKHYESLKECYMLFFPDLKAFAENNFKSLT
ncbi:MAG: DUF479 domain-containing protein [Chitinophagaceae bacterium]|jgi:acyl carrier protein phosphodiesterase|nr:DUF479 domain-containing protein [Chitinophagaceae bacterium]